MLQGSDHGRDIGRAEHGVAQDRLSLLTGSLGRWRGWQRRNGSFALHSLLLCGTLIVPRKRTGQDGYNTLQTRARKNTGERDHQKSL
jgi:hypothetical protein